MGVPTPAAPRVPLPEAIERERRPQVVAAHALAALVLVRADGHLGVDIEAVDASLASRREDHLLRDLVVYVVVGRALLRAREPHRREVLPREGALRVVELVGEADADDLLEHTPRALLDGSYDP